MNEQEFKEFVDSLKEQGLTDEDILDIFYSAFKEGELDREDLDSVAKAMGYQAKKEFMEDSGEKEEGGDVKGVSKDQIEAAKEIDEGESEEDFKERVAEGEDVEEKDDGAEKGEDEKDEKSEDEDDERKEAMKYFD